MDHAKQFIIRRLGYSLLSLFLLSLTIFFFVRVTGDPATLLVEPGASEADIAAIHHQFGLDRPLCGAILAVHGQASHAAISASRSITRRRCWIFIFDGCRTRCCLPPWR